MQVAIGDWEIDHAYAIVHIANQLERIADALESIVFGDDDEDDGDPSDGPFSTQEQEDSDGFADYPDVDCN